MGMGVLKMRILSSIAAFCPVELAAKRSETRRTPPDRDGRQDGQDGQVDGADEHRPSQAAPRQLYLERPHLSDPQAEL